MKITFDVIGVPKPGGSKTAFYNKKLGRALVVDACKNKDWKNSVAIAGSIEMKRRGFPIMAGPLLVKFQFRLPRPKYHYDKKGMVKPQFVAACHVKTPDVLKCARSTEDALTKIVWIDDSQIIEETITKRFAGEPGATITVEDLA
jgi:Holliday junction resolvase RusA-like endonuclease